MRLSQFFGSTVLPMVEHPGKVAIGMANAVKKYLPQQTIAAATGWNNLNSFHKNQERSRVQMKGDSGALATKMVGNHLSLTDFLRKCQSDERITASIVSGLRSSNGKKEEGTDKRAMGNKVTQANNSVGKLQSIIAAMSDIATVFAIGGTYGMVGATVALALNAVLKRSVDRTVSRNRPQPLLGLLMGSEAGIRSRNSDMAWAKMQGMDLHQSQFMGIAEGPMQQVTLHKVAGMQVDSRMQTPVSGIEKSLPVAERLPAIAHTVAMKQRAFPAMKYFDDRTIMAGTNAQQMNVGKKLTGGNLPMMNTNRLIEHPNKSGLMNSTYSISGRNTPQEQDARPNDKETGNRRRYDGNQKKGGDERTVHIHFDKPLIDRFTVEVKDVKDGMGDIKRKIEEVLLEILNSANLIK